MFGFGYDNSTNTYKVVVLCQESKVVRVFCLGDNIWRNIQSLPVVCLPSQFSQFNNGVYLCGTLN